MDCNVCNNRTKALLVFTFQCYIICTFPADGSLYCQSDSVWTNLNDFLGSIKLAIFVVLRHLGILNPLSAPLQDLSLKNIRNHPLSTPLHYPYGLPAPWRALPAASPAGRSRPAGPLRWSAGAAGGIVAGWKSPSAAQFGGSGRRSAGRCGRWVAQSPTPCPSALSTEQGRNFVY